MAKAYSHDLRIRAVELVNSGFVVKKVVDLLNISKSALYDWLVKFEKTKSVEPKKDWQKGHSHKITDMAQFKKFADENKNLTLDELAKKWGGVSRMTVYRALKKIGYSKKKRPLVS